MAPEESTSENVNCSKVTVASVHKGAKGQDTDAGNRGEESEGTPERRIERESWNGGRKERRA
ncbi:MAG: hypothetical protein ACLRS1_08600 [Oscillospiraceae bacterium]